LNAEAPERFSHKFLENLGFTSSNDRLLIGLLKDLGFLDADAVPQKRYYEYLDRSQSARVLAECIREGFSDLFAVNVNAHDMNADEIKNKLRTLYAGSKTDVILGRIAKTFEALCSIADFSKHKPGVKTDIKSESPPKPKPLLVEESHQSNIHEREKIGVSSLQYHINIILPESRDQAVYDAIFKAMREHLG
jgi:hypothetical protein